MKQSPCHTYPLPAPAKAQDPIGTPTNKKTSKRYQSLSKRISSKEASRSPLPQTPDFHKILPLDLGWTDSELRLFLKSPIELRAMLEKKEEDVRNLTFKADYYVNKCQDLGTQLAAAIGAFESQTEQNTEDQNYLAMTLELVRKENARLSAMVSHYAQREREHRSMAERVDFYARKEKADQQMQAITSLIWCEPCDPPDVYTAQGEAQLEEEASRVIFTAQDDACAQLMGISSLIWADPGEKRKAETDAGWTPGMSKPCWTTSEMLDTTPAAKRH